METYAPVLDQHPLDEREQPQQDRPGGAVRDAPRQSAQDVIPPAYAKANREWKRSENGADGYCQVIRTLQLVKDYVHSPRQYYPDHESIPIKEVVASKWREFVVEEDEDGTNRVNRLNYEVCTLQALREKVRMREIWIKGPTAIAILTMTCRRTLARS